jgi:hypothetical protein
MPHMSYRIHEKHGNFMKGGQVDKKSIQVKSPVMGLYFQSIFGKAGNSKEKKEGTIRASCEDIYLYLLRCEQKHKTELAGNIQSSSITITVVS